MIIAFCLQSLTLEDISNTISIATPVILLIWFYYSQKQVLSKSYFDEIYAGFTNPVLKQESKVINSGMIMNIRDTDNNGYFRGEFDFAESTTNIINNRAIPNKVIDGIYTFLGKLNFEIYENKSRHPFRPEENRIYKGTLYVVDRLDFAFENYKIETYLNAEYDIVHYREMQTLTFTLKKNYKSGSSDMLPKTFTLYKKTGANFEPYINVKTGVFNGDTRVDKH